MRHWWDNADRGKLMYLEKNLSPYYFMHQKILTIWPSIKTWASVVRGEQLTTSAIAWPNKQWVKMHCKGCIYS